MYQRGHPHFAPTHYDELAAVDTRTGTDVDIFPKKPYSAVRQQFMAKTRAIYQRKDFDCAGQNHHCNAELFNNEIREMVANSKATVITFRVQYEPETDDEPAEETAIGVCEGFPVLSRVTCRETSISRWRAAFPGVKDDELLERAAANPRRVR